MGFCGRSEGLGGDWGGIFFFFSLFHPFFPFLLYHQHRGFVILPPDHDRAEPQELHSTTFPPRCPPAPQTAQPRGRAGQEFCVAECPHSLPLFLGLWPPALAIARNAELLMNPRLKYSWGSAAVIAFVNIFFFSCSASHTAPGACVRTRLPLLTPS